jgi:hypothetical protein
MLLYDRRKGLRRDLLKAFFDFLTFLQSNDRIEVNRTARISSLFKY